MKLHTQILLCCSSPLVDLKPRNKPKISFETRYDLAPLLIKTHNLKQAWVMQMKSRGKTSHSKNPKNPNINKPPKNWNVSKIRNTRAVNMLSSNAGHDMFTFLKTWHLRRKGKTDCNEQYISKFKQSFRSIKFKNILKSMFVILYTSVLLKAPQLAITPGPFPEKAGGVGKRRHVWLQGSIVMAHTLILPFLLTQICCIYA